MQVGQEDTYDWLNSDDYPTGEEPPIFAVNRFDIRIPRQSLQAPASASSPVNRLRACVLRTYSVKCKLAPRC